MDQIYAEVGSLSDIHQALRTRFDEKDISRVTVDASANLASGHASKLLAAVPIKNFGNQTLWRVLEVAGLRMALIEDPEAIARVTNRLPKRKRRIRPMAGSVRRRPPVGISHR